MSTCAYGGYPIYVKMDGKKVLCKASKWMGEKANLNTITDWEIDCPKCKTTFEYARGQDFSCPNCKLAKDKTWKISPDKIANMSISEMVKEYSFKELRAAGYQYGVTGTSSKSLAKKILSAAENLLN